MTELRVIEPPSLDVPGCCAPRSTPTGPAAAVQGTTFHFALNVSDLPRSVEFYSKLFGVAPAKSYADYAKFELSQPPLVFSLVPQSPGTQGALSHFGFPVADTAAVHAATERLIAAGLKVTCQEGTVCGYARQDKVWVADPDQNFWEIYVVHEDIDPESVRVGYDGHAPAEFAAAPPEAKIVYEHRVTDPAASSLPYPPGTVDEARLTGTFNAALTDDERAALLAAVFTALKPGAVLQVHGLVASCPPGEGRLVLPGVAALVKRVPTEQQPLEELAAAGFAGLQITRLPEAPAFVHGTAELREVKLTAFKPARSEAADERRVVVYKGPFASTTDESGQEYVRGRRTTITAAQEELLARSTAAASFLFLQQTGAGCSASPC